MGVSEFLNCFWGWTPPTVFGFIEVLVIPVQGGVVQSWGVEHVV